MDDRSNIHNGLPEYRILEVNWLLIFLAYIVR